MKGITALLPLLVLGLSFPSYPKNGKEQFRNGKPPEISKPAPRIQPEKPAPAPRVRPEKPVPAPKVKEVPPRGDVRVSPIPRPPRQKLDPKPRVSTPPKPRPSRPIPIQPVVREGKRYQPYVWNRHTYHRVHPPYRHHAPHVWASYHGPGHWGWGGFHYRWSWVYAPFWGWHGYYFRPYVVYATPAYWLADFFLVTTLYAPYVSDYPYRDYGEGYREGYAAGQQNVVVTDAVKEQIREQIEEELSREKRVAPPVSIVDQLADTDYLFAVSEGFTTVPSGQSSVCKLSEGDLLKSRGAPAKGEGFARMVVVTSKKEDCPAGAEVRIALTDLAKFQNHFSETIDNGLQRLEKERGEIRTE